MAVFFTASAAGGLFAEKEPGKPRRSKTLAGQTHPVLAEALFRFDNRQASFRIRRGKGRGKTVAMNLKPADKSGGRWVLTFEGLYRLFLRKRPDTTVELVRMALIESNQRVSFEPALALIPSRILSREQIRSTGRASVCKTESGEKTNAGDYVHRINGLSRSRLESPDGPIRAYLLNYETRIEFSLAKLRFDLEIGFSENRELVYWRSRKTMEKLGLFDETTFRSMIRCRTCSR